MPIKRLPRRCGNDGIAVSETILKSWWMGGSFGLIFGGLFAFTAPGVMPRSSASVSCRFVRDTSVASLLAEFCTQCPLGPPSSPLFPPLPHPHHCVSVAGWLVVTFLCAQSCPVCSVGPCPCTSPPCFSVIRHRSRVFFCAFRALLRRGRPCRTCPAGASSCFPIFKAAVPCHPLSHVRWLDRCSRIGIWFSGVLRSATVAGCLSLLGAASGFCSVFV